MNETRPLGPAWQKPHGTAITKRRGRPRTTLACTVCRARKIKCDFQTADGNICSACRSSGAHCSINRKHDRLKHNSLEDMITIRGRLQSLESTLHQEAGQYLDLSAHLSGTTESTDSLDLSAHETRDHVALPSKFQQPKSSRAFERQPNQTIAEFQIASTKPVDTTTCIDLQNYLDDTEGFVSNHAANMTPPAIQSSPHQDLPVSKDASRLVACEMHDETRSHPAATHRQPGFYGTTSQYHVQLQCADIDLGFTEKDLEAELTIDIDSPHVQKTMLDSFWKSDQLWSNVVNKDLFMTHRAIGGSSKYYSISLEDAMLACGSRNSTSNTIRQIGRKFLDRARQGLLKQLESPTISTIQGFLLLSNFEAGIGRNRVGWTYCGIAIRLLFDLGLHEDCSDLVKQMVVTQTEADCRQTLFLATFLYDTIYAWYLGRPRSIPLATVQSALYLDGKNDHNNTGMSALHAWAGLCVHMANVGDMFNAPLPLDLNALSQICATIRTFYYSLPPGLACTDSQMSSLDASAYALNTQFCALQILLHRLPTRHRHPKQDLDPLENDEVVLPGFTQQESLGAIYANAVRIARLVHFLVQIHGIEHIVPTILDNIFVAAVALIRHILRNTHQASSQDRDKLWLQKLSNTLEAVQKHYHMVCGIRAALFYIVEKTPLAGVFKAGSCQGYSIKGGSERTHLSPSLGDQEGHDGFLGDFIFEPSVMGGDWYPDAEFGVFD